MEDEISIGLFLEKIRDPTGNFLGIKWCTLWGAFRVPWKGTSGGLPPKNVNLLRKKGWFDFVDDFVQPEWAIEGVRLDKELNYPKTIQVKSIRCENTLNILGQLKGFSKWN